MSEEDDISGFSVLPEGCISIIISFTSPKDACILSAVSPVFKFAADSDTVWERFLPSDYPDIKSRSVSPVVMYSTRSKKELYFRLCDDPLLIDGGKLSFTLSKPSGKKCYMLCARKLGIIWSENPAYWKWKSLTESRFAEVAKLRSGFRIDIHGAMQAQMLSLKTRYAGYLVYKTLENSTGLDEPSMACVKLIQHEFKGEYNSVYLIEPAHGRGGAVHTMPEERKDGWMEIKLGEYYNDEGDEGDILLQLFEVQNLHRKSGLIVEGIELRPIEG